MLISHFEADSTSALRSPKLPQRLRFMSGRSFGWSKTNILLGSKSSYWKQLFTLLDLGCRQIIGTPSRSIFHAGESSKICEK
jgi:hypothetical protein